MSDPTPPSTPASTTKSVPMKWIAAAVGALVVLGGTFFAGMAYENNRIENELKEAFSGLGGDSDESLFGEDEPAEDAPEPVELTEGTPIEVQDSSGGTVTITLLSKKMNNEASADEAMARNLEYMVKVENTGTTPVSVSLGGNFETEAGQVLDFSGVMCAENDLPYDEIDPGQWVEGCSSSDLPTDAGKLVFDGFTPTLWMPVSAG